LASYAPAAAATSVKAPVASILKAPIKVAVTRHGRVAYRSVGTGRPLVLIMGFGSSMEDWDPAFVNGLAKSRRVIIFDNAGIGKSSAVKTTLTISAMADRTSALIDALKLGRTDVLGWSMGGMIAQALAARHTGQLRRLVLAATKPGNGKGLSVAPEVSKLLATLGPDEFVAALFPDDQLAAAKAYGAGIAKYAPRSTVPDELYGTQRAAINGWSDGKEAAGHALGKVKIKTLVAAGLDDRFMPVDNSRMLGKLLPNATLKLYRDAGHGFLFQPDTRFAKRVTTFLG
jgi:pimeloyl-ACP methyl ester carboxylesterase